MCTRARTRGQSIHEREVHLVCLRLGWCMSLHPYSHVGLRHGPRVLIVIFYAHTFSSCYKFYPRFLVGRRSCHEFTLPWWWKRLMRLLQTFNKILRYLERYVRLAERDHGDATPLVGYIHGRGDKRTENITAARGAVLSNGST